MRFFEALEKRGKIIYITRERWKHIATEHPAVANRIEEIKDTLANPLVIRESEHDPNVRFYYRYYKDIKLKAKYLLVVVKFLNDEGFIITSFYIDKIKGLK